MIADFGLSRVMAENKLSMLTEVCGTPGVSSSFPAHVRELKRFGSTWRPKFSKRVRYCYSMALTVILTSLLAGHGKPVDVWAMGVITYFLLAGAHTWHACNDYGAERLV
jgi:serine/threonine protein kinase